MSTGALTWNPSRPEIAATRSSTDGPTGGDCRAGSQGSATTLSMIEKPTPDKESRLHAPCSTGPSEQVSQPAGTSNVIGTGKPGASVCFAAATAPPPGVGDGR